jgi:3-hydroxyacyl-[acyl-carrier-protein] dehydratase
MWIDRILELESGRRAVAIKNVSASEDHVHNHFQADGEWKALPLHPASLIVEGMAQTAGILVGQAREYREKVILAKVANATLDFDILSGETVRFTADLERLDDIGASTKGVVDIRVAGSDAWHRIGTIDLMFSHVDKNLSGLEFPEHNFVFTDDFRTLLRISGFEANF